MSNTAQSDHIFLLLKKEPESTELWKACAPFSCDCNAHAASTSLFRWVTTQISLRLASICEQRGTIRGACQAFHYHVTNTSTNEEQNGICSIDWIIEMDSLRELWCKIPSHFKTILFLLSSSTISAFHDCLSTRFAPCAGADLMRLNTCLFFLSHSQYPITTYL